MEMTRALALKLLKREDWGRAPAAPRTRRSALTQRRLRAAARRKEHSSRSISP
jgi:hypothetical protein